MSDVYYARPVTVTDERMQEALEKQAKQRALREALDSQIHSRASVDGRSSSNANVPPSGMTKAQQKRVELMQLQAERQQQQQQQQQPPQVHSSVSLPPNFAMSSSFAFGGGGGGPPPRQNGVYDSMSLPAGALQHPGAGGGIEGTLSPTTVSRPFNNPNFNLAEVYAQQQTTNRGALHAPASELPVPLSPRQITNASPHEPLNYPPKGATSGSAYHTKQLTSSDMLRGSTAQSDWPPQRQGGAGAGAGGGGSEHVQNILRMAQRVTDQPTSVPQQFTPSNEARGADPKPRQSGTPLHQGAGAQRREKSRERVSESRVEKLQKELQTRQHEMQRMRDKERNWEEQVKQLKTELKNARQKERDLSKLVQEKPQRAETAPNTGSISKLAPLDEPKRNKDTAPERLNRPVNHHQQGVSGAGQPTRKDFNNARVFQNETFRPITAPLEPIDDVVRSSGQQQLPPLPDSLKMASFNTRKIAFGLQQTANPIPMSYQQLCDFVKSQVVTQFQADALWRLFSGEEPPKKPSPPPGSRPRDPSRRTSAVPTSPTYETYEELADEEDEEYYEDDDA